MAALQVITKTTYDASSDDKVDIMAMITLQWFIFLTFSCIYQWLQSHTRTKCRRTDSNPITGKVSTMHGDDRKHPNMVSCTRIKSANDHRDLTDSLCVTGFYFLRTKPIRISTPSNLNTINTWWNLISRTPGPQLTSQVHGIRGYVGDFRPPRQVGNSW